MLWCVLETLFFLSRLSALPFESSVSAQAFSAFQLSKDLPLVHGSVLSVYVRTTICGHAPNGTHWTLVGWQGELLLLREGDERGYSMFFSQKKVTLQKGRKTRTDFCGKSYQARTLFGTAMTTICSRMVVFKDNVPALFLFLSRSLSLVGWQGQAKARAPWWPCCGHMGTSRYEGSCW